MAEKLSLESNWSTAGRHTLQDKGVHSKIYHTIKQWAAKVLVLSIQFYHKLYRVNQQLVTISKCSD